MDISPIRTEHDYRQVLRQLSRLVDLDPAFGTADGDMLDVLSTLVQAYEARHFPIEAPNPVGAIRFRMEQGGLTVKDLEPYIGKPNRVYEILSGKRSLTLPMIRSLSRHLGIPPGSLIGT